MSELNKQLNKIQKELNAPKNRTNKFGGYKYRSAEDILEAVKPLLGELTLTISDKMAVLGEQSYINTDKNIELAEGQRFYVKATATLSDGNEKIETTAYAREALNKKGMDEAQITGSASSYARKYALNGLFAIADSDDPDTTNKHGKEDVMDEDIL